MLPNLLKLDYLYGFLSSCGSGIGCFSQYSFLFILQINPALFHLFERRHYALFLLGCAGSLFNTRAMLPFMLLILLDLDYSKMGKKEKLWVILFFALQVGILLSFTRWGG